MAVAHPNVTLIAHTALTQDAIDVFGNEEHYLFHDDVEDADALAEVAGRSCYRAYGRKNPDTAKNDGYLAHIIDQAHNSVLEHASATFYLTGVSRSLLAELTRHRHLSFSVQSQRYVNESKSACVIPPVMRDDPDAVKALSDWQDAVNSVYENMVLDLSSKGVARKQAREAARALMPNMTETRIVVTGSMAAYRYVLSRRLDPSADAEIREVAGMILAELKKVAPNSFADFD